MLSVANSTKLKMSITCTSHINNIHNYHMCLILCHSIIGLLLGTLVFGSGTCTSVFCVKPMVTPIPRISKIMYADRDTLWTCNHHHRQNLSDILFTQPEDHNMQEWWKLEKPPAKSYGLSTVFT